MATYAIGDIQGCFDELQRLLVAIGFKRKSDRLWFVGDLVNRGPQSLETLRFVKDLGDTAVTVLGNHDLHLLMLAAGFAKPHNDDTLGAILGAPDCDSLLDWLRCLPLLHFQGKHLLVHAGLLPQWSVAQAQSAASEVEQALRGPAYRNFLSKLYGSKPDHWSDDLKGNDRLRVIVNAMTRLRFCSPKGVMEFQTKGETSKAPRGYLPWFEAPGRRSAGATIICGHWSAVGIIVANLLRFTWKIVGCFRWSAGYRHAQCACNSRLRGTRQAAPILSGGFDEGQKIEFRHDARRLRYFP